MSLTLPLITVIVVNDQIAICKLWQTILERTPSIACPAYAKDGQEAINLVREVRPDVVLMDVLMPGMHGDEATTIIKNEFPDTIVIMYSADGRAETFARASGAEEFLSMPVTPTELASTIRQVYNEQHGND